MEQLIEYSINIGAFDFLLENIKKSEDQINVKSGDLSESNITFVIGQEPYLKDSTSNRILSIMKNIDFDNKNCAFNIHDKSIDNEGIELIKKNNINPLTAPYKEIISPYKNLRSHLKFKMSEDNNIYSAWIEGSLAACEEKIENNKIYWIWEIGAVSYTHLRAHET